ncbi:GntR family transcriptional regulator [Aliikangiella sp. IMCC44653]
MESLLHLFSLNPSSGVPIYRQLIDQIKQAIKMRLLSPGEQLPSVRNLAGALQINPMTISKAFAQLELEGVLIRKRGVGMLVAKSEQENSIPSDVESQLNSFISAARKSQLDDEQIVTLVQQTLSIKRNS